jgi:hypothetical protein
MIEFNRNELEHFADFHSSSGNHDSRRTWAETWFEDRLFLSLVLLAAFALLGILFIAAVLFVQFTVGVLGFRVDILNDAARWLLAGNRLILAVGALGLGALVFAALARYRLLRNPAMYAIAGCPQCYENELIRVRRRRRDHLFQFVRLPLCRYACRNCTWFGLRLLGSPRLPRNTVEDVSEDEQWPAGVVLADVPFEDLAE